MSRNAKGERTDNILADLGFPDTDALAAKAVLAKKVNDILDPRRLTQSDAAKLLGVPQPKLSAIRNYKLRGLSLERLIVALRQRMKIVVSPSSAEAPPRIDVAA